VTRERIGKGFSNDFLIKSVKKLLNVANCVHLYLIYGLSGDNYDSWFQMLPILAEIRRSYSFYSPDLFGKEQRFDEKSIRIEFSLTNFEPCMGTPLADAPEIDFKAKDEFLRRWFQALYENGFMVSPDMDYKTAGGRIGRKENSYKLLMALKRGGPELTDKLINVFPNGVSRSILDDEALKFLEYK
jgi:radical SAM superfamily enzyme YgiQ (UPF0313 family)